MQNIGNKVEFQYLCQVTTQIIKRYYKGEINTVLSCFHPEVCWCIDRENKVYRIKELKENICKRESVYWLSENMIKKYCINRQICRVEAEYYLFLSKERFCPVQKIYIRTFWVRQDIYWKLLELHENMLWKTNSGILKIENIEREWEFLALEEICYIEARGKHSLIQTVQAEIEVFQSITELENMAGHKLIKVHRSYLMNPYYVRKLERFELFMSTGKRIPVAEKRYTTIKKYLLEYPLTKGIFQKIVR